MFVNLSNHPSKTWNETQKKAAQQYGQIIDMPFPTISATGDELYILDLVRDIKVQKLYRFNPLNDVIHVMGELCFTFALVQELKKNGFVCLASTSERVVEEKESGIKEVKFEFMRFRAY